MSLFESLTRKFAGEKPAYSDENRTQIAEIIRKRGDKIPVVPVVPVGPVVPVVPVGPVGPVSPEGMCNLCGMPLNMRCGKTGQPHSQTPPNINNIVPKPNEPVKPQEKERNIAFENFEKQTKNYRDFPRFAEGLTLAIQIMATFKKGDKFDPIFKTMGIVRDDVVELMERIIEPYNEMKGPNEKIKVKSIGKKKKMESIHRYLFESIFGFTKNTSADTIDKNLKKFDAMLKDFDSAETPFFNMPDTALCTLVIESIDEGKILIQDDQTLVFGQELNGLAEEIDFVRTALDIEDEKAPIRNILPPLRKDEKKPQNKEQERRTPEQTAQEDDVVSVAKTIGPMDEKIGDMIHSLEEILNLPKDDPRRDELENMNHPLVNSVLVANGIKSGDLVGLVIRHLENEGKILEPINVALHLRDLADEMAQLLSI